MSQPLLSLSFFVLTALSIPTYACDGPEPSHRIHHIQGSAAQSPLLGKVVEVEAVVAGDFQGKAALNGFFIQEERKDFDDDPNTSEGLFVFDPRSIQSVAMGDRLRIKGVVAEHQGLTQLTSLQSIEVCSSAHEIEAQSLSFPLASDTALEALEGMAVSFSEALTVTDNYNLSRYGEVLLSAGGRLLKSTELYPAGKSAAAHSRKTQFSSIILDDARKGKNLDPLAFLVEDAGTLRAPRVGDTLPASTGVISEGFGQYRLMLNNKNAQLVSSNPRPEMPAPSQVNEIRVASYNLYNYFNGDGQGGGFPTARGAKTLVEFQRQRAKTIAALSAMNADVFALLEMENDGDQSGSAIQDLIAGLKQQGLHYRAVSSGQQRLGTDDIAVAMIYKPENIQLQGAAAILDSSVDAEFLDKLNRPSLAQSFKLNSSSESDKAGLEFTLVVNHFKSKGSSCEHVGDKDLDDGQGNCNGTRTRAAAALARWIESKPTASQSSNTLLVGDFNAYSKEDPIRALEQAGFAKPKVEGGAAFSYVFKGLSGSLDHVLVSEALLANIDREQIWSINADEAKVLDYKLGFKTLKQQRDLYDTSPFRSSDHDPVWVDIKID